MPSRDAVVDLLGALAYGELSAFDQLADDAGLAPDPGRTGRRCRRWRPSSSATTSCLADRLAELGAEPEDAMAPFVAALETYHSLTEPSTWLESVVKAYVGDGMAADFYREVAAFVDDGTGRADPRRCSPTPAGPSSRCARSRRRSPSSRPIAGRLALWGRRLVGEAISQTQHVLADRDSLMLLLVEGTGDLTGVAALITRITDRHAERMAALGLGQLTPWPYSSGTRLSGLLFGYHRLRGGSRMRLALSARLLTFGAAG